MKWTYPLFIYSNYYPSSPKCKQKIPNKWSISIHNSNIPEVLDIQIQLPKSFSECSLLLCGFLVEITLFCSVQGSHCGGFSGCRSGTLGHLSFSSCGTWDYLACGIFLDQGSNLCLLRSLVDDLPVHHPGKPSHPLFSAAAFYKTQTVPYTILRYLTYNIFRNISDQQSVCTNPA